MAVRHTDILPLGQRAPLLRLSHVDKIFGGEVVALKDMTLQVNHGDFISLLGPSGCGKSTALRIISDLMHPTRGRVEWEGPHGRGDLGVVFQEPTLMPWATVAQNVWLPFRLAGEKQLRRGSRMDRLTRGACGWLGLERFSTPYPRELSRRMTDCASRSPGHRHQPAPDPDGDEPFAALDEIPTGGATSSTTTF